MGQCGQVFSYIKMAKGKIVTHWNCFTDAIVYYVTEWIGVSAMSEVDATSRACALTHERRKPYPLSLYHPIMFEQPIEIEDREGYFYPFNSTLNKIQTWVNNNTDQFESFDCDIFFYMSRSLLINDDHSMSNFYSIGGIMNPFRCRFSNWRQPFVIPGGISYDNENFGFVIARTIASGFGIPFDEEVGCESGFIMQIFETEGLNSWSRCSKKKFKDIFRNKKFSCFKMVRYLSRRREDQYDE
ncbi:uncharacterized protein LOC141538226 [Cotesia typhae]|uniref:uncharacterized protein LOC141538226 n=1 Tax=Cotesia typhae TaxID=2053667 RepID=UPI003D69D3DF